MTTDTICPTFVDLHAIASQFALEAGADPLGANARNTSVRAGPCEVFVTAVEGAGTSREDRGDTWIFVDRGSITLDFDSRSLTIAAGTSAVIARGTQYSWRASEKAVVIGMRYTHLDPSEGGIFAIDNQAPLSPSNPPADELLIGDRPSCRSHNVFRSISGEFQCGTWDSTPYQRVPIFFAHSELMHLLAGEVTFTDEAGRTATFRKGDTFIIEQGARCSWESHQHVAKIYALYRPVA